MKEDAQNGPLMDQPRRQKGLTLPQIRTVFGTVEEVLEQRTESQSNKSQDGSRDAMAEDDISGMVQDALFQARKATATLSPHNQSSGTQKPYTSFFPSLENMISTSRSTTLQNAQSLLHGKNTSVVAPSITESQRDQPDGSVINESTANSETIEQAAKGAAMNYVQNMSAKDATSMMTNPSSFVIRKVEGEIANAKKVAQQAFDRVKGVSASSDKNVVDRTARTTPAIVDLTDAEDDTFDEREELQLAASSTWKSEGPNSTWRSEGPSSTWRSEGPQSTWRSEGPSSTWKSDGEQQLDSMVSEDYGGGLTYEYTVAPSMSSVGHPTTAFCSLDDAIIRVMDAGINIIDLTSVNEDNVVRTQPSEDFVQFRAVSPTQNSVLSTGTAEEDNGLNAIEMTDELKQSDTKKTTPTVKTYPILPVKQETIVKASDEVLKDNSQKPDTNATPIVTVKQESRESRADRLRKLRQPMLIVKEASHEESLGIPDDQDTMTLEQRDEVPANDCVGEDMGTEAQKNKDEKIEDDQKPEAADEETNAEPVSQQQVEESFIDSVETAEVAAEFHEAKEEPASTKTVEIGVDKNIQAADIEGDAEPVTDQQVEEALIDSVETDEIVDDSHDEKEELGIVNAETKSADADPVTDEQVEDALINSVETAGSYNVKEESNSVKAETESEEGPLDLASGFANLLSFFRDRDEKNLTEKEVNSEPSGAQRSNTEAEPSTENATTEKVEVQLDGNISAEMKNLEKPETEEDSIVASEKSANDTSDVRDTTIGKQTPVTDPEEAADVKRAASLDAAALINSLVNFGATDTVENQAVAASEDRTNVVKEEPVISVAASTEEIQDVEASEIPADVEEGEPESESEATDKNGNQADAASEDHTDGVEEEPADSANNGAAAAAVINSLVNFGATDKDEIQVATANEDRTNVVEEERVVSVAASTEEIQDVEASEIPADVEEGEPESESEDDQEESEGPLSKLFGAAREARRDLANLGLAFVQPISIENQTEDGGGESLEQQPFSAVLTKSGESNEKNSLIDEVATMIPSMDGQLMPAPLPSQYTVDSEYDAEPESSARSVGDVEDFRYEAEQEPHANDVSTGQLDPLGSLYRAPVPEKDLEPKATRVSLKNKYNDPPGEYTTRPTEDIINDNRIEAPIPELSVLDPTDEITKLQTSIMGESVTRRFNACGALKMFAMSKKSQLALARTDGFFDALIVALTTDLYGKDREAAFGTRTRALEILLRICVPKENRVIIFYHPDLVEAIVSCAIEDSGEIRMAACSVLAMLAKSGHLREPMAQVEDLLDVLADSLLGVDSHKAPQAAKTVDEIHENDASVATDDFSSGSESSDDSSASGSETSYANARRRNKQNRRSAKSKQQEKEEKKRETAKQVTINACAALLHLSKQCAAGHFMCHNTSILNALLILSQQFEHPMHTKCLEILCNLTRLPSNNEILAEQPSVVPVMLRLSTSESEEDRVWALRMLQNISASKAGKQVLVSPFALELLSMSVLRKQADEQKAAMAALFNLSTDPGCLMGITNTRDVLSSLVLVAQDMNTISEVRVMACDMLSTIGLWFQKLAARGIVPDGVKESVLPTNVCTGWNRWDNEEMKC